MLAPSVCALVCICAAVAAGAGESLCLRAAALAVITLLLLTELYRAYIHWMIVTLKFLKISLWRAAAHMMSLDCSAYESWVVMCTLAAILYT